MPSILAIALAYAFLLFLLLLAVFKSELGAASKFTLVALCAGFYLWHYQALQDYLGWPAGNALPRKFEMVSSLIVEPDLKGDDPGAIYIWVRDLDSEGGVPRAYRLPYQKQLHGKVAETERKQRNGQRHVGTPVAGGAGANPDIEFEAMRRDGKQHKLAPSN